ncbi:DUF6745 domain-containing protein [Gordonia sp. NPDC003504]
MSTEPSDRSAAEHVVAEMYRLCNLPRPRFTWVDSPVAAAQIVSGATDHASRDICSLITGTRSRIDRRIHRRLNTAPYPYRWVTRARFMSIETAVREGIGVDDVIRAALHDALRTTIFDSIAPAIRTIVPAQPNVVTWYGQHEAHRLAFQDIYRVLGLIGFTRRELHVLDLQMRIAEATGWWWPLDGVCLMSERPTGLRTEPTPGAVHGERRLHADSSPAVEFADGHRVFAIHGTTVPHWVLDDPSPERNIEIRRCAIERIGWDAYVASARLSLVDETDDPGNAGHPLRLYAPPPEWRRRDRILLATNGSVERDGTRRCYGLTVPQWLPTALAAAGWTYGLSAETYSQLTRRT